MNPVAEYQIGVESVENGNGTVLGHTDGSRETGTKRTSKDFPQRYVLVTMAFLAFVNVYMMYLNLSVALPAMVDHNATKLRVLDIQKGVFFENSELDSDLLKEGNESFTSKREKRQRNASEDDILFLQSKRYKDVYLTSNLGDESVIPVIHDVLTAPAIDKNWKNESVQLTEATSKPTTSTTRTTTANKSATLQTQSQSEIGDKTYNEFSATQEADKMTPATEPATEIFATLSLVRKKTDEEDIEAIRKKTRRRKKRDSSKLKQNLHDGFTTLPSFHQAQIVPVTKSPSTPTTSDEKVKEKGNIRANETADFTATERGDVKLSESSIKESSPTMRSSSSDLFVTEVPEILAAESKINVATSNNIPSSTVVTSSGLQLTVSQINYHESTPFFVEPTSASQSHDTTAGTVVADKLGSTSTEASTVTKVNLIDNSVGTETSIETIPDMHHDITTSVPEVMSFAFASTGGRRTTVAQTTVNDGSLKKKETSTAAVVADILGTTATQPDNGARDMKPLTSTEFTTAGDLYYSTTPVPEELKNVFITTEATDLPSETVEGSRLQKSVKIDLTTLSAIYQLSSISNENFKENLINDTRATTKGEIVEPENFLTDQPLNLVPASTGIKDSLLESDTVFGTASANNISKSDSHQFVTPLSIPCQLFMFMNCSIHGSYDLIDKKGANHSDGVEWVTLRPLPKPGASLDYEGYYDPLGSAAEEDSEEKHGRKDHKSHQKYNFTDQFKLVNCSRIKPKDSEEKDSDIKCYSSQGVIKLNIIDENDSTSSSSSSSSSSEENDEGNKEKKEESPEEKDDEGGNKEDNDEGEKKARQRGGRYKEVFYGRHGRPRTYLTEILKNAEEGGDEDEKGTNTYLSEREEEVEDGQNKDENEELSNPEETRSSSRNRNVNKFRKAEAECDGSSEECEEEEDEDEDEEEGAEEEEGENEEENEQKGEENSTGGRSSGLIKLDEKIPSSVCFFKKKVDSVSFEGYEDGEYIWEQDVQNKIIRAYYWGFLLSQIPAGKLSSLAGGKITLFVGVLVAGVITLFTPLLASAGAYWLLTGRVILGMMQGMCMPATQALLAQWAPPLERTRMVAYTYSGIAVGATIGGPMSAYVVQQIGWRTLFYGQGAIALIWSALWFLLVTESPKTHPRIKTKEKQFILSSIGHQHAGVGLPVPWCSILRSRHVLALMLAQGSFIWAWHTLLHYAPKYIATVLHEKLSSVQSIWAAALFCMFVATCAYGTIGDWLRKSRKVSTVSIRRAANSICSIVSAAFLVGVAQSFCNITAVKVCFALAIAMGVPGAFSGIFVNSLDLAPNHAAAITGISGTFATTATILAPYYWDLIVFGRPTLERWRTIWYTSAIFLLLANCLYFILVGTKEQKWNRPIEVLNIPKRRDEEHGAIGRRRPNYSHGIKPQAYASTEHL